MHFSAPVQSYHFTSNEANVIYLLLTTAAMIFDAVLIGSDTNFMLAYSRMLVLTSNGMVKDRHIERE